MDERGGIATARFLLRQLRLRHVGMGFYWACAMLTFRTSHLFPHADNLPLVATVLLLFSFGINILTMCVLAYFEHRKPMTVAHLPAWLFATLIVIGLVSLTVAGSAETIRVEIFMLGCTLTGIGYGYFWVAWAMTYARIHPNITQVALPLAFILTICTYFLVSFITEWAHIPAFMVMAPLPFISWLLMMRCRKAPEYDKQPCLTRNIAATFTSLSDVLIASAVFSFLFGFLWESSVITLVSVNETHRIPLVIALAAGITLFIVTLFGRLKINITMLYQYGAPFIVVSFALFPLLFYTNPILVNSFMDGGFTILEILVWVIVSELSYDNRVCGVLTGAVTRGVFLLFRLMGVVAAYFLHEFAAGSIISSTMFSIISVYAIGMWMYMVRRNARKNGQVTHPASEDECDDARRSGRESRGQGDGSRDGVTGRNDRRGDRVMEKPRFVDLCNVIDETYNLTQRESEILPYLAQGREAKYIADELYISESTVRTHIKHILEKTGAPSKQGLIDFVYVHGAELLATDR